MSLQVHYRPKSFKTFVGNKEIIESLTELLKRKKVPSAFLFTGPGGTGKAQPLNSKILTEEGFVKMKDIKIGDRLASIDGTENIVTGIFPQGEKQIYEVIFSDGRSVKCCGDHLWKVYHNTWDKSKIVNTKELIKKLSFKTYKNSINVDLYSGKFSESNIQNIDPWLFGMLLGDGTLSNRTPKITKKDKVVLKKIKERLPENTELKHINKYDYRIISKTTKHVKGVQGVVKNKIQLILDDLNLSGKRSYEKFIPKQYLHSSFYQRFNLLAGLIDSDGHIDKNGAVTYSTSSKQLADDIVYLIRSLGGIANYRERIPTYMYKGENKKGRINYNITIYLPNIHKLELFSEKKNRLKKRKWHRTLNIVSISKLKKENCQCISVSHNSKLYVTDGFTMTHNTTIARVLKNVLKCSDSDWKELNAADDRGIDSIRKLIESMKFTPLSGNKKIFLLDEAHCFHKDTMVSTLNGQRKISDICIGDSVYNLNGIDTVEKIFINKVPLNSIARVNKSDGTCTFCSKDHEYYIDGEWIEAKDLANKEQIKRFEKNKEIERIRVESVEIYKRGSNDKSFSSIVSDTDRNRGYLEFYDLQIKKNHSYIADNNMVHNCLTKPSQEALLKALEEPPHYVHWIICTTNPEALKQTFKRRCHTYELEPLQESDMHLLFKKILKKEKREMIPMSVREKIIELSDGSAGQALKLLDQVIDMKEDADRALGVLQSAGSGLFEDSRELSRILISNMPPNTKWGKVKKLLKTMKGDAENHRYGILGYLNSVMLNNGGDDVFFIMQPFRKSFMYDGTSGLISACYEAIFNKE